jgi:CopA family copper-resistance protein
MIPSSRNGRGRTGIPPLLLGLVISIFPITWAAEARVVESDLFIEEKTIEIGGQVSRALAINGQIPAPTLRWKEGDTARIRVHNGLDTSASLHWHGLLVPNGQDGVPGLTNVPIEPGASHVFEFALKQAGTYWYHSHSGLQEQRGLYGAIVIEEATPSPSFDRDHVVVLSDWTSEKPEEILRLLKSGSETFSRQKGSLQTVWGAYRANGLGAMFERSLNRMPPMDASDVAYDAFLTNGEEEQNLEALPGQRIRLRVVNAAASSYFYLEYAGEPLKVIAADGKDVEAVDLGRMLIGVAETYDFVVQVPPEGAAEFRATAQDGSGHTSLWIGEGQKRSAEDVPPPNLYAAHHAQHAQHEGGEHAPSADRLARHDKHRNHENHDEADNPDKHKNHKNHKNHKKHTSRDDHNNHANREDRDSVKVPERPMPPYNRLRSPVATTLSGSAPPREIRLELTGDMERYVWSFNGKTLSEADKIPVKKGEILRIVFENKTMMHHPLHLHGHFFRVLNGQASHAPLKHTVDVNPLGTTVIEFLADEEGDWFLHCHILYHMKAGMARIVHYQDWDPPAALDESRRSLLSDPWYAWADAAALSNFTEGYMTTSSTRHQLAFEWEVGWQDVPSAEYELLASYRYHFNRFYSALLGGHFQDGQNRAVFGFEALLPLNIGSQIWVDSEGEVRITLEKDLQLTSRLGVVGEVQYDTETEWEGRTLLLFNVNRFLDLTAGWHSEYGFGGGLNLRY